MSPPLTRRRLAVPLIAGALISLSAGVARALPSDPTGSPPSPPASTSTAARARGPEAASERPLVGVLRVARGEVSVEPARLRGAKGALETEEAEVPEPAGRAERTEDAALERVGQLLGAGEVVQVEDGWSELLLGAHIRARLSSQTSLVLDGPRALRLTRGRVWLEVGHALRDPLRVELGEGAIEIEPGASVVLERSGGGFAYVERGRARLPWGPVVPPGHVGMAKDGTAPRVGGGEVFALVRREARAGLGDLAGWRAFLLERAAGVRLGERPVRGVEALVEGRILQHASSGERLYEEAVRPPPFFPEERTSAPGPTR